LYFTYLYCLLENDHTQTHTHGFYIHNFYIIHNMMMMMSVKRHFSMLARVGRLLPYNCQIANHSSHTTRPALPFSSINSFSRFKDGNEMDVTIHGDDWSQTFY